MIKIILKVFRCILPNSGNRTRHHNDRRAIVQDGEDDSTANMIANQTFVTAVVPISDNEDNNETNTLQNQQQERRRRQRTRFWFRRRQSRTAEQSQLQEATIVEALLLRPTEPFEILDQREPVVIVEPQQDTINPHTHQPARTSPLGFEVSNNTGNNTSNHCNQSYRRLRSLESPLVSPPRPTLQRTASGGAFPPLPILERQEHNIQSDNDSGFFLPSIAERLFLRGELGIGMPIDGSFRSVNPGANHSIVSPKSPPPAAVNIRPSPYRLSKAMSEITLPGDIRHHSLPFERGDYLDDQELEECLRKLEHEHTKEVGQRKNDVQERNDVVQALIKTGSLSSDSSEKVARFLYGQYEALHQQAIKKKPAKYAPPTILEQPSHPSMQDHTLYSSPRRDYSKKSFRQGESPRR